MARLDADFSNYEASTGFELIPPGDYAARIVDSEVRDSKAGNRMAKFTLEILGPSHAGRKLWVQFVLNNEVAMSRFKGFLTAAGHHNPNYVADTEELHGRELTVHVKIKKQEGFDDQNDVSNFKPLTAPAHVDPAAGYAPQAAFGPAYGAPPIPAQPQAWPQGQPPTGYQGQAQPPTQAAPAFGQPAPGAPAGPPPWERPAA